MFIWTGSTDSTSLFLTEVYSLFWYSLSYKYFDFFTKSSTVYMDQIFYKEMYFQQ